jgi:hypothetical protein
VEEILKINSDIIKLKYKNYSISYDDVNNNFKLNSDKYTYSDLEGFVVNDENEAGIISFNKI